MAARVGSPGFGEKGDAVPRRLVGKRVLLRGPVTSDADDRLAAGFDREVIRLQGGEPSDFTEPMTRAWADQWYERLAADENPWSWMIEHEGSQVGTARLYNPVHVDRKA